MASTKSYDLQMERYAAAPAFELREIAHSKEMKADEVETADVVAYAGESRMFVKKARRKGKLITLKGICKHGLEVEAVLLRK